MLSTFCHTNTAATQPTIYQISHPSERSMAFFHCWYLRSRSSSLIFGAVLVSSFGMRWFTSHLFTALPAAMAAPCGNSQISSTAQCKWMKLLPVLLTRPLLDGLLRVPPNPLAIEASPCSASFRRPPSIWLNANGNPLTSLPICRAPGSIPPPERRAQYVHVAYFRSSHRWPYGQRFD